MPVNRTKDTVQIAFDAPKATKDRFRALADHHEMTLREMLDALMESFSKKKPRKSSKKTTISENP